MTIVAQDSFNRADSAVSLGSATVGGSWSIPAIAPGGAAWGIDSNRAYCVSPPSSYFTSTVDVPKNLAVIGSESGDHTVSATITLSTTSPNAGLVAKYKDVNNFISCYLHNTTWQGFDVVGCFAGVWMSLVSTSAIIAKGSTVAATLTVGEVWSLHISGTTVASGTLTAPQIAALSGPTSGGLMLASGLFYGTSPNDPGDSRFDDFLFTTPDPVAGEPERWAAGFAFDH